MNDQDRHNLLHLSKILATAAQKRLPIRNAGCGKTAYHDRNRRRKLTRWSDRRVMLTLNRHIRKHGNTKVSAKLKAQIRCRFGMGPYTFSISDRFMDFQEEEDGR